MPPGYFITASDTGAGKTYVTAALATALRQRGQQVAVRKPVESGCKDVDGQLLAQDAEQLRQAAGAWEARDTVCPYLLRAALSPPRAARFMKHKLFVHELLAACTAPATADWLLVEGAGGWFAPLSEDGLNSDLAAALGLPVLLVVPDRLGAINQALLAIHAITHCGLRLAGVILNQIEAEQPYGMDNYADLRLWTGAPITRIGYKANADVLLDWLQPCKTWSIP